MCPLSPQLFAHHYPERMGKFVLVEAPTLFNTLWKLLAPHVDPVTAKKLSFVKGPTGRGGGEDLDSLSELLDEEPMAWLREEMAENRYSGCGRWSQPYRRRQLIAWPLANACIMCQVIHFLDRIFPCIRNRVCTFEC